MGQAGDRQPGLRGLAMRQAFMRSDERQGYGVWNDKPYELPLTPEEAAKHGLADDQSVYLPFLHEFCQWFVVKIVAPGKTSENLSDSP